MGLASHADVSEWREVARTLLMASVPPKDIDWHTGEGGDLFGQSANPLPKIPLRAARPHVTRAFMDMAATVLCHASSTRLPVLYRLLWRLQTTRGLLGFAPDPDVNAARVMEKAVRRDGHKMKAFVRFREIPAQTDERRRFVAWFEPDHYIVGRTAPFFSARFGDMDWMILTPKGSAAFEGGELTLSEEPATQPSLEDVTEALWTTYFASTFNPARLKVRAMQSEMPKKYWRNLPEAALIPQLVASAGKRVEQMAAQALQMPPVFHERLTARRDQKKTPVIASCAFTRLQEDATACTRCVLHACATQAVAGEGTGRDGLMFVLEQPDDRDDLTGRPLSGTPGQIMDALLAQLGLTRQEVRITHAVRHAAFVASGRTRTLRPPLALEISACHHWLEKEVALVRPRLVVTMGKAAALSVFGSSMNEDVSSGVMRETVFGVPGMAASAMPATQKGLASFYKEMMAVKNFIVS
ncbi:TIGR03915 family putative DNA repair protein [Acetobacter estunensis]|nr:TIGR03915 family putative DNA repair protein [Acetobacter estunensis]